MEKTFRRYLNRPAARQAFVEAEAAAFLAHQIRVLRVQRGWSQKMLAKKLSTTQTAVSRLEDASYGRISFKTMVELARAFDVAPVLKFVSTITLMKERWVIRRDALEVPTFDDESMHVAFEDKPDSYLTLAQTPMTSIVGGGVVEWVDVGTSPMLAQVRNASPSANSYARPLPAMREAAAIAYERGNQ